MKFSIYTSLFNYSPEKFDIVDAFRNWLKYGNEIVIGTFKEQEKDIVAAIEAEIVGLWDQTFTFKVVAGEDTSIDDPFFDGKLKNAALQACSNEVVIQQDMDERLSGKKEDWQHVGESLLAMGAPIGCMIPVIDLYKDLDHYKSIGSKWYIHLKEGAYRGVVNFAWRNSEHVDISKSDSTELVDSEGNLLPMCHYNLFVTDSRPISGLDIDHCHIVHLGYLDLEKRKQNNKFWQPIWSARNGSEVEVATTTEQLEKENQAIPHGLPREWWK